MDYTVTIEKLVDGGLGLARTDAGIVFVRNVLPGEKLRIRTDRLQGGQVIATPVEIITPSAHRRKAPCKYFGVCGGCNWLHIDYECQLKCKKDILAENLKRIGKIDKIPEIELFRSPEFGYRHRARFKLNTATNSAGFYKFKSHEIINIEQCPLLRPYLNTFLMQLRTNIKDIHVSTEEISAIAGQGSSVASFPSIKGVSSDRTSLNIGNFTFEVSGNSFFQSNAYLCEKLASWGKDYLHGDKIVDLYGGVGLFSIFLNERFKLGVTVENAEPQSLLAERNMSINRIKNVKSVCSNVEDFLNKKTVAYDKIDAIVVDPPRTGLSEKARLGILKSGTESIMYVSCNSATQARDISVLIKLGKYSIDKIALFDLYPNTNHIETIILLIKKS
jgi:23S rRNA (uracil1939-C5)-methyltransferase